MLYIHDTFAKGINHHFGCRTWTLNPKLPFPIQGSAGGAWALEQAHQITLERRKVKRRIWYTGPLGWRPWEGPQETKICHWHGAWLTRGAMELRTET